MADIAESAIQIDYPAREMSSGRRTWALAALTVTFMFNFLDRQVMALLVTPIKKDLGLSDTQVSLLIGFAFVVFYVAAGIPLSRLIDRGSRKWIVGLGVGFWSLMTMGCGLARNFAQLAVARIGLGVGESCNTPAIYSLAADLYPREKLARALAVINLGKSLGIHVVAEGIEQDAQAERLVRLGCDFGQGFLFSKAVGAKRVPALVGRLHENAAARCRHPATAGLRIVGGNG